MTKLIEHDPVRTLFGDEALPAAYAITLAKILNDNLVLVRIQDEVQRYFGAIAISRMSDGELWSLKKRITLLLADPAATNKPGVANLENAQELNRLHNLGDHSKCTPESCYVKAHPPAPVESPKPIPDTPVEVITSRPEQPRRWHVRWYCDLIHKCIVAEIPDDEIMRFGGSPKDAVKLIFRGETCPAHIIAQYERMVTA